MMDQIYAVVARRHGLDPEHVRREIQAALDAAWDNPDPAAQEKQRCMFPLGKPDVDELLQKLAAIVSLMQ